MRILYLHQYFNTPDEPGGTRSYWIAQKLIEHNHQVIMLTSKNDIKKIKEEKEINGIRVIYLNVKYSQKMGVFGRLISFSKYMVKSCILVLKLRNQYDKVYATSTPLSIGIPALLAKKILGKPYLFEVRDLWPEVPIQMGGIKNVILISILRYLEKLIYSNADKIIALSPGMKEGVIETGIREAKVFMIPNMSKPNEFFPRPINPAISKQFNIDPKFINIIYFGAIGKANGLQTVISNFIQAKNNSFRFYIAGDGSEKERIEEEIKLKHIDNIFLIGRHPMHIISEIVNCCDLSIVCFENIPILKTNSPNKLFDSLSAGKPVIVNSDGWTRSLIEENQCGFYYDQTDDNAFSKLLESIEANKNQLIEKGLNARKLSLNRFNRDILTEKIVDLI